MIIKSDRSPELEVSFSFTCLCITVIIIFYQVKVIAEAKTAIDHAKKVAFGQVLH